MTPYEQAQKYVAAIPGAVSGQSGHSQTFAVASCLVNGYLLGDADAMAILQEYNSRCQPPWSERELQHKLTSARSTPHTNPPGHLLSSKTTKAPKNVTAHKMTPAAPTAPKPAPAKRVYDLNPDTKLPDPLPDGARALLRVAFKEGECVRICHATLNDEGREVPKDEGATLSREEWLAKLDSKGGDPNGLYHNKAGTGIYITVNPMQRGKSKDSDVTAFRHCLVEFDGISQQEQWALYEASRLPCTAVIDSGGKSVHAWVKVDAKDRAEYDERVRMIYAHFEAYGLDAKNKNPSRFSRLPNCVRFTRRQQLLALNVGAESFTAWQVEQEHDKLPKAVRMTDLMGLDVSNDPNCVIGFRDGKTTRYLCKGKSAWLIGPSGVGKSTLTTEFAVGWALGKPVFGITPARPLKSLIYQAENDRYDLAEMVQGIVKAYDLDEFNHEAEFERINSNILYITDRNSVNESFVAKLARIIDRDRPDVVWIDPLLSFAGIDVSKQDQCSAFLRTVLDPVLDSTGVVMIGIHHTGKVKPMKETAQMTAIEHAYSGIGSSELVNWARAVMVLRPVTDHQFELKLAKRGGRAAATNPDGSYATSSVWLQHGQGTLRWEQITPPEDEPYNPEKQERKEKPKSFHEKILAKGMTSFFEGCKRDGESYNEISERLQAWAESNHVDGKLPTAKKSIERLFEDGKLTKKEGKYFAKN